MTADIGGIAGRATGIGHRTSGIEDRGARTMTPAQPDQLARLTHDGDVAGVIRQLGTLTPAEREAQREALETRRATTGLLTEPVSWDRHSEREAAARLAVELGCLADPAAAAELLWRAECRGMEQLPLGGAWIRDVFDLQPIAWRAGLAAEIIAWNRADLVEHLVRDTGCPVPTSPSFIGGWLDNRASCRYPAHLLGGPRPGATLLERLRADDLTPKLLTPAVGMYQITLDTAGFHEARTRGELADHRLAVFISLSAEGLLDRAALLRRIAQDLPPKGGGPDVEDVLEALGLTEREQAWMARQRHWMAEPDFVRQLQDGSRSLVSDRLRSLRDLAFTPAENAPVARDHVPLLDLSVSVATYAQEVLRDLDEAGHLEPDVVTEVCERVLLRPEKKLVRTQLTWLDRMARRDPARATRTVLDAAVAFAHEDLDLQERALAVVARHLGASDARVLPALRTAAERLSPAFEARVADLLGTATTDAGAATAAGPAQPVPPTERYEDVLPVLTGPYPVPGPLRTAAEAAEQVAAVVADDRDVVAFERALDGLVRHAHLDRDGLARLLRPVVHTEPAPIADCAQRDVYDVAAALRGDEPRKEHVDARHAGSGGFSAGGEFLWARLVEAIGIIETGAQPFLLAVPTDSTGALDAAVLVERISALEELGVTPAPADLSQALLRVTNADERARAAAGTLGSDAGRRLRRWLSEGGVPHRDFEPENWPDDDGPGRIGTPPVADAPGPLHPAATALLEPTGNQDVYAAMAPFWLAQLPHHRELVLARNFAPYGTHLWLDAETLPCAAESGGPAGFATHLALAFALADNWQGARDAAADTLLVLAARAQLDPALLGRQIPEVVLRPYSTEGVPELTDSLRTVAGTGAYATAWTVLGAVLPGLLRADPRPRGLNAFLTLAVDCASRCGAKREIPELTALAAHRGSSQVLKNARLLRDTLK
jgi:hypothetical protein